MSVMTGQWYLRNLEREARRAALERETDALLYADRRGHIPAEAGAAATITSSFDARVASPAGPETRHARERAGPLMSTRAGSEPEVILLPPCGRGLGPCTAIIEAGPAGATLRCLSCGCIAPYRGAAWGRAHADLPRG
jgi:hypothetical protein